MTQEPVLRCNDTTLLTKEYFVATKQALLEHPAAETMHFVILTGRANLKLNEPERERYLRYDVTVRIHLTPHRTKYQDIDMYTSSVLLCLFDQYKTDLIIH